MYAKTCNQYSVVLVRLELLLDLGIIQNRFGAGIDIMLVVDALRRGARRSRVGIDLDRLLG